MGIIDRFSIMDLVQFSGTYDSAKVLSMQSDFMFEFIKEFDMRAVLTVSQRENTVKFIIISLGDNESDPDLDIFRLDRDNFHNVIKDEFTKNM